MTRFTPACLASCSHSDNSNPMTSQTTGPRAHQERISKRTLRQTAAIWQRSELVMLVICSLHLPKMTASTLKRQANYPLVWRHFLLFIAGVLSTGSHSTTAPHRPCTSLSYSLSQFLRKAETTDRLASVDYLLPRNLSHTEIICTTHNYPSMAGFSMPLPISGGISITP